MRFAILGPLQIERARVTGLDRPAQRRLLVTLLFHAGQPLQTDVLIDRFWSDEPPATARAALQTHLSAIRRQLGDELVATTAAGYRLDLDGHELDREAFDRYAAAARSAASRGAWEEAAEAASDALRLWRGDPYPELAGDEFAQPELARLEELRLELVELQASALLATGRGEQALSDLDAVAVEHPLRERLTELIMLARTRAGRPTDALEAYRQLRTILSEMGLEPSPALRDLEERILREDPTLVAPRVHHNLPTPPTSFVGRESEMDELARLLSERRLVTVTGVGGTGKTRLSIEVAHRLLDRFPDGAYLVRLGGLVDPELVVTEVAATLGLRTERQPTLNAITDTLRQRGVLVLLDNCEHLVDAASQVATAIMEAGPGPVVLATSREAFGLPAEHVFDVPPLRTPPKDLVDVGAIASHDAVHLFVDRASHADPSFTLGPDSAASVAAICRQLDGLPLAIELVAARMRSLSADAIAAQLADRFGLRLAAGRHGAERRQRTLEAAIDWSYRLLDELERSLMARLSVFRGGFRLDAAQQICSDDTMPPHAVAGLLARLVEQSLLVRDSAGPELRYRLLETIRRFAGDRLDSEGPAGDIVQRHREWYVALADAAAPHLEDAEQPAWIERVGTDRENLDAALDSAIGDGERHAAARVAEVLAWYHARLGQHRRAATEMRIALDRLEPTAEPERVAAIGVRLAGTFYSIGDEQGALAEARRACELVADRKPSQAKVRALSELASLHLRIVQMDPQPAIDASREAVHVAAIIGDRYAQSHALRTLGTALCWAGDVEEGIAQLREALAISIAIRNPTAILGVYMRLYISLVDFARDDDAATQVVDEALHWLDTDGGNWGQSANLLMWFAYGSLRAGQSRRAEEMLDRTAAYHVEGMSSMSYHTLRGLLRWVQGRLTEAQNEVQRLRATDPRPRYFRLLYPLEAEIAADEGRLGDVRRLANEHLEAKLIPAEESTKAGTLRALVRAEIDAVTSNPVAAPEHRNRAEEATREIRRLVTEHPTDALSGIQLEPPPVYLALAEAELARGTDDAVNAWRGVLEQPLFAYWRAYARWRLGESLVVASRADEATDALAEARHRATDLGAHLLRGRIDATARGGGIRPQSVPPSPPGGRTRHPGRIGP